VLTSIPTKPETQTCCPAFTAWLYSGELGALGVLMTSRTRPSYLATAPLSRTRSSNGGFPALTCPPASPEGVPIQRAGTALMIGYRMARSHPIMRYAGARRPPGVAAVIAFMYPVGREARDRVGDLCAGGLRTCCGCWGLTSFICDRRSGRDRPRNAPPMYDRNDITGQQAERNVNGAMKEGGQGGTLSSSG
jgi:hypothetical protein